MSATPDRLCTFAPSRAVAALLAGGANAQGHTLVGRPAAVLALSIEGLLELVPQWAERLAEHAEEELSWVWKGAWLPLMEGIAHFGGEVLWLQDNRLMAWWPAPAEAQVQARLQAATSCALELSRRFAAHRPAGAHPVALGLVAGLGAGELLLGGLAGAPRQLAVGGLACTDALRALATSSGPGAWLGPAARLTLGARARVLAQGPEGLRVEDVEPGEAPPLAAPHLFEPAFGAAHAPELAVVGLSGGTSPERLVRGTVLALRLPLPEPAGALACLEAALAGIRSHNGIVDTALIEEDHLSLEARFGLGDQDHKNRVDEAVAVALALRRLHPGLGAGIASGPLYLGALEAEHSAAFVAGGPASTRAARLAGEPGAVFLGRHAHLDASPSVARSPEAAETWRVHALAPEGEATLGDAAALFGRSEELARLERSMEALVNGVSSVIVFEGEAGIGKTALVQATRSLALKHGLEAWLTGARADATADPWHAWRELAGALFDLGPLDPVGTRRAKVLRAMALHPDLLDGAALLDPLLQIELTETPRTAQMTGRSRAFNAEELLVALLNRAAALRPLVVVVEDAHWFDAESWSLAVQVSQRVRPLLMVLTTRPLPEPMPAAALRVLDSLTTTRWTLDALPLSGTRRVLGRAWGAADLPAEIVDFVHRRGEGNPLFCEELALLLRDQGHVAVTQGRLERVATMEALEALPMPPAVRDVVAGRIERLRPSQRELLGAASIIGPVFGLNALRDVHPVEGGLARFDADLVELQSADLARPEGSGEERVFAFKHQTHLEAAYRLMPPDQRRAAHGAMARRIEEEHADRIEAYSPALAHHWQQAGDPGRAVDYLERAGAQAIRQGAHAEAQAHLRQALGLLDEHRLGGVSAVRLARWQRLLAEASLGLGEVERAHTHASESLVLLGQGATHETRPLALVGALLQHLVLVPTWGLWGRGEGPQRERLTEAALANQRLSQAQYFQLDLTGFLGSCLRAVNLGVLAGKEAPVSGPYAMLGLVCGSVGLRSLGRLYFRRSMAIATQLGDAREVSFTHQVRALDHMAFAEWDQATVHAQAARKGFGDIGDQDGAETGHTMLGMVAHFTGRLEESRAEFETLTRLARQSNNPQHQAWGIYSVARIQCAQGVFDEPVERLHTALELLEPTKDEASRAICWGSLALIHVRREEWRRARECAERAGAICWSRPPSTLAVIDALWQLTEAHQVLWERAREEGGAQADALAAACGRDLKALGRFARMYPFGRSYLHIAQARQAVVLGNEATARRLVARAEATAQRQGAAYQGALAAELRARLDPATRGDAAARFRELGCTWHADRLRT